LLFIWPKLNERDELEALVAELENGTDEVSDADGPPIFSDEPTIIGVGETRGAATGVSLTGGIVLVITTLTGVGVGSID
jgi:hypothetical protein